MTDFRALCAELEEAYAWCIKEYMTAPAEQDALIQRARAALSQPEPEGPTDEEITQWVSDCADATRESEAEHYWAFEVPNDYICGITRAVLARWGTSNLAEVRRSLGDPADGEVAELVAWLRQRWPHMAHIPNSDYAMGVRAADLLERLSPPQPIPVSERLPGPGDCDAEGRCWLCGKVESDWRLLNPEKSGVPQLKYCFSHWLPAQALPVPSDD